MQRNDLPHNKPYSELTDDERTENILKVLEPLWRDLRRALADPAETIGGLLAAEFPDAQVKRDANGTIIITLSSI